MNVSAIAALSGVSQPTAAADLTASGRSPATAEAAQRKQVAGQFEAILVRQLLGKSVGSMLGGDEGVAGTVYGDMMTDVLAQKLTSGGGFGRASLIERQLTPRGTPVDPAVPAAPAPSTTPSP
jgi:flagellar protein FlgJ